MTAPAERFVFTEDSSAPVCLSDTHFTGLLAKWGLQDAWLLRRFRFQSVSRCSGAAATHSSVSGSDVGALRFHSGLAEDLLVSLFSDESVQRAFTEGGRRSAVSTGGGGPLPRGGAVSFRSLSTSWVTLDALDRLVEAKVVRRVGGDAAAAAPDATVDEAEMGAEEEELFHGERLPVVKRMDQLLPGEVVVSDEVRALFLTAHSRTVPYGNGYGYETATGGDDAMSAEDDDEEDDIMAGMYGSGGKLPRRQLRAVFTPAERDEFLYHVLWRLVAGGGAMNQFEDDFAVYKDAARTLYKSLVTSVQVRENEEGQCVPTVDAVVLQVRHVKGWTLFPSTDGMAPSNMNYCYVIVNPRQQEVVVWYRLPW